MKSKNENAKPKILIAGAGPAGASLAIRLAKENFRVCLIERDRFPRHKLCGEFISPECFRHFRELNVLDEMLSAGGERIAETFFYAPDGKCVGVPSKWFNNSENALSLSRAEMDLRLLEKAGESGVEVLEESSVVNLLCENERISGVKFRTKDGAAKEFFADLLIDATGRARVLGKMAEKIVGKQKAQKNQTPHTNKFVGFKSHLANVNLNRGACEIYFFRGGYGGLSYVENDLANFCFLIRSDAVREFNSNVEQIIKNLVFENRRAYKTLKNAEPAHEWLAVAVDGFGEKNLRPAKNLFTVGDAGAFIDPFTGSGMLMALESAEILAECLARDCFSPDSIAERYQLEHARKFQKRLFVSSLMRRAAFSPVFAKTLITVLSLGDFPRKILARATRPSFSHTKFD